MPQSSSRQHLRIAIAYPASVPWVGLYIQGVMDYAEQHGDWEILTSPPTLGSADEAAFRLEEFRGWPGDGLIASITTPRELRIARTLGFPVVNLSGFLPTSRDIPRVMVDHHRIGQLAGEHLTRRGLRQIAYYGIEGAWYSEVRLAGLRSVVEPLGIEVNCLRSSPGLNRSISWHARISPLANWLQGLPKPIGILAVQDYRARALLDACGLLGLAVPGDVAILGVDNDLMVCEHSRPSLSSVSRNSQRVGHASAELLHRLIRGEAPPGADLLIPPDAVVSRQSTDTVFAEDPLTLQAVRLLQATVERPLRMKELADQLGVSKRTLELKFRRHLACSPHAFITRLRLDQARQLLQSGGRSQREVAEACGFGSARNLRLALQQACKTN